MENELKSGLIGVVRAEKECDIYCPICHKLLHVEAGQVIPRCCGKPMQMLDLKRQPLLKNNGACAIIKAG